MPDYNDFLFSPLSQKMQMISESIRQNPIKPTIAEMVLNPHKIIDYYIKNTKDVNKTKKFNPLTTSMVEIAMAIAKQIAEKKWIELTEEISALYLAESFVIGGIDQLKEALDNAQIKYSKDEIDELLDQLSPLLVKLEKIQKDIESKEQERDE